MFLNANYVRKNKKCFYVVLDCYTKTSRIVTADTQLVVLRSQGYRDLFSLRALNMLLQLMAPEVDYCAQHHYPVDLLLLEHQLEHG